MAYKLIPVCKALDHLLYNVLIPLDYNVETGVREIQEAAKLSYRIQSDPYSVS